MSKKIILLAGKAGSGKTYIGNLLEKGGWTHLCFAEALKDEVSAHYKIDKEIFYSQEGKSSYYRRGITHRDLLILNASYIRFIKGRDYFVRKVKENITKNNYYNIVISDFRFPLEFEYLKNNLKEYQIKTVYLMRYSSISVNDFLSENSLSHFKFDIHHHNNDGHKVVQTIENLFNT